MPPSPVLVLGVYHQTLAVMRSLHDAGFGVILGVGAGWCPERYSTACATTWRHPRFDDAAFRTALLRFVQEYPGLTAVFPVGEDSALAVADALSGYADAPPVAMVEPDLLRRCRDKQQANRLAELAGLPVPASQVVRSVAELVGAAERIGFPVIVKGLTSKRSVLGRKAYLLPDAAALERAFERWPEGHEELLVQAYVEGPLEACDYAAQVGRVVSYFQASSVRTDMPDGTGYAVDFRSDPVSPDLLESCRRFCAATDYDGPGLLQMIRSTRDGRLWFVENNPRLSAGIAQAVLCGQDVPLVALRIALARRSGERLADFDPRSGYLAGVRTHWLLRDLQGILDRRSELTATEILQRLRQLVGSLAAADTHMVWRWRDPLPSLLLCAQLVRRLRRRDRRGSS